MVILEILNFGFDAKKASPFISKHLHIHPDSKMQVC